MPPPSGHLPPKSIHTHSPSFLCRNNAPTLNHHYLPDLWLTHQHQQHLLILLTKAFGKRWISNLSLISILESNIILACFFPPAEYYPNRILGGAQRRFGSDDECQIVENWYLYWVGGECHLEEESSCAEKAGRMRATPKACTGTFMHLFVYFYKCKQEVGIFTINWSYCKLSLDGNPAEYFCKACKFHFTKLERRSDARSNSAIRC